MALCGMVGTVARPKARSILGDVAAEGGAPALGPYPRWVRVELVREARAGAYRTWSLRDPEDAALILEPLLRREPTETFVACLLDTKHRPNAIHRCALGSIDSVPVEPRSVFTAALLANAAAVIVAHNHPSGDPEPSAQDILVTRRLLQCGGILGIPVLDHLVIGAGCWTSIRGLCPDLPWERGGQDA
jgi:DNA repair protein RadC